LLYFFMLYLLCFIFYAISALLYMLFETFETIELTDVQTYRQSRFLKRIKTIKCSIVCFPKQTLIYKTMLFAGTVPANNLFLYITVSTLCLY